MQPLRRVGSAASPIGAPLGNFDVDQRPALVSPRPFLQTQAVTSTPPLTPRTQASVTTNASFPSAPKAMTYSQSLPTVSGGQTRLLGSGSSYVMQSMPHLGAIGHQQSMPGQLSAQPMYGLPQYGQLPQNLRRASSPQHAMQHPLHHDSSTGSTPASRSRAASESTTHNSVRLSPSTSGSSISRVLSPRGHEGDAAPSRRAPGHQPHVAGNSMSENVFSSALSAASSSSASLQKLPGRPDVARVPQTLSAASRLDQRTELPRFGVEEKIGRDTSLEAGSVESIIQDFKRSMQKASLSPRDVRSSSSDNNGINSVREAWAQGVSGVGQSGLTTPVEGSEVFDGFGWSLMTSGSLTRLRSPRKSSFKELGLTRGSSTHSLKAAAAVAMSRSALESGKSSPRGRSSPLGSPRQMPQTPQTDSAHSLMLTAPWQQYKSVANRLQQMQATDSQSSTPRKHIDMHSGCDSRPRDAASPQLSERVQRAANDANRNDAQNAAPSRLGQCVPDKAASEQWPELPVISRRKEIAQDDELSSGCLNSDSVLVPSGQFRPQSRAESDEGGTPNHLKVKVRPPDKASLESDTAAFATSPADAAET